MVKRIPRQIPILTVLIFALLSFGCRKGIQGTLPPDQYPASSFSAVFDAFWSGMNTNYVFWSIDTTNWDRVHDEYAPKFSRLDINNPVHVDSAFSYFRQITNGLIDGHYRLTFTLPQLADSFLQPSAVKRYRVPPLPFSFFSKTITQRYFSRYWWATTPFQSVVAGKPDTLSQGIVAGLIDPQIVYLHLDAFYLSDLLGHRGFEILDTPWNQFLSLLHGNNVKGLILDLRSNPGGLLADLNLVAGQLIDSPLHFADTREKSGNGRLDYTPWAPAIATPQSAVSYSQPIVILTDQNSQSMAEMTTMALKCLPQTWIIRDTTWGATGPLNTDVGLYGGGQFSFAAFGYVYTSSAEYRYRDGKFYEGKGFPPDQYVPVQPAAISTGSDPQLEAAITYLNH
ncbi:MAG TPA: S41 family peptidase [Puia sp.]|jgi:hypothetical protein|nr:S41 family peptidase [Puia sp.]